VVVLARHSVRDHRHDVSGLAKVIEVIAFMLSPYSWILACLLAATMGMAERNQA
jgi:hypothetical protein